MNPQEKLIRAKEYAQQMEAHLSHGRMKEGKIAALEGLAICGIQCDFENKSLAITVPGIPVTTHSLLETPTLALHDLPKISDPLLEIALEILPNLALSVLAMTLDVDLFKVLERAAILITRQHGKCAHTAMIWATYSLLLSLEEQFDESHQVAEHVLQEVELQQNQKHMSAVHNLLASVSLYFKSPISRCVEIHNQGYEQSLMEYDNAKAVLNYNNMLFMHLAQGRDLEDLYAHMNVQAFLFKGKELGIILPGILKSYVDALLFANNLPAVSQLGTPELLDSQIKIHQAARLHFTHLLAYWQGDIETALIAGSEVQGYITQLPPFVYFIEHYLFYALSLLAQSEHTGELTPETTIIIDEAKSKLRRLAEGYPTNFEAMYRLLAASYKLQLDRPFFEVLEDYQQAIKSARLNEFTQYEALGNELLGKYYEKLGLVEYAQHHLTAAHNLYQDWGCKLKTQQLQKQYTFLVISAGTDSEKQNVSYAEASNQENSPEFKIAHEQISIDKIIDSVQLLTEKRDREALLLYLLEVLLKQSAATKATLVIEDKEGRISGYFATRQNGSDILTVHKTRASLEAEYKWDLLDYIRYINAPLVIENARSFPKNIVTPSHLTEKLPIACLPVYEGKSLVGSVYLENVSTPNIGLVELLDILNLVLTQAAVALENVAHYESIQSVHNDLERRVQKRSLELEAANNELEAFSYAVSHDLRGPLRSIRGFTQALIEDHSQEFDTLGNDYLNRIYANSGRMTLLIEGLLELSRVSRKELSRERVDLSSLAKTIAKNLSDSHPTQFVKFKCADHLEVYGDERLLYSLVDNLLGNAWKYTAKVDFPAIEFGVCEQGGKIIYFVKDNGAGFNMKFQSDLFKSFKRLHSAKEFEGTGIGLATVQRIIDRHNGEVWAESKPNEGAIFYFTLGGDS